MDIKPNIENRCETSFGTGTRNGNEAATVRAKDSQPFGVQGLQRHGPKTEGPLRQVVHPDSQACPVCKPHRVNAQKSWAKSFRPWPATPAIR